MSVSTLLRKRFWRRLRCKIFEWQLKVLIVCLSSFHRYALSAYIPMFFEEMGVHGARPVKLLAFTAVAAWLIVISSLATAQSTTQPSESSSRGKQAATDQSTPDQSASEEDQAKALAKAVQNPVASLISVPLQNNTNFDIGPNDRSQNILNIQPVIPVRVSKNWNLIMRIVTPVIYQPSIASLVIPAEHSFESSGDARAGRHESHFFPVTGKT